VTRDDLRAALKNRNVAAFLRTIREGESSQDDSAYTVMYGGQHFTSFADHPRRLNAANGITSSAAGAYQFLSKTWDGLVRQYGFEDFSPQSQDEAAVALVQGRRALEDLYRGDLATALDKCSWEWASLPPNRYGQGAMTAERVYATYDKWGGSCLPVEEEKSMPFPALALAALPTLIESIPALTRLFGKGQQSEKNAQTAEKVIEIVKTATGAVSIEDAITKVTTDPAAKVAANEAVQTAFYSLTEAGGGGIEGAREYGLKAAEVPMLKQPAFVISMVLMLLPIMLLTDVLFVHPGNYTGELRTQIVTGILVVVSIVGSFWLGSSMSSRTKDEALARLR
jgi:muramidase (phage lysozyme)